MPVDILCLQADQRVYLNIRDVVINGNFKTYLVCKEPDDFFTAYMQKLLKTIKSLAGDYPTLSLPVCEGMDEVIIIESLSLSPCLSLSLYVCLSVCLSVSVSVSVSLSVSLSFPLSLSVSLSLSLSLSFSLLFYGMGGLSTVKIWRTQFD